MYQASSQQQTHKLRPDLNSDSIAMQMQVKGLAAQSLLHTPMKKVQWGGQKGPAGHVASSSVFQIQGQGQWPPSHALHVGLQAALVALAANLLRLILC